ncbi:MAG: agmatine deiminase [Lachnospiraceae bacterium]|nr:agmatine deiminase [Lachnospiraceae bacterium]
MQIVDETLAGAGFRMPGEFEKHMGCIMIWPVRPGSWTNCGREAKETFLEIIRAVSESEKVYVLAGDEHIEELRMRLADIPNTQALNIETDDAWARDVGPTFVKDDRGNIVGIDWKFNAWGGDFDGLYAHYDMDDKAAGLICKALKTECYDAHPFVCEGGSIHSDGEGTLMVTETCLLSKGRNPDLSKEKIEEKLKETLGIHKVLWLPRGIVGDETNEHVDNICAFVKPGEVVLAWCDDENDPQYKASNETYEYLRSVTDAKGRKLTIHKMPIPGKPVCITKKELDAMSFEEGEDIREEGERLAASYVNFYISNKGVILPQFGDENDEKAVELIKQLFPDRTVYPIYARSVIVGGGNIHCITQQIPQ